MLITSFENDGFGSRRAVVFASALILLSLLASGCGQKAENPDPSATPALEGQALDLVLLNAAQVGIMTELEKAENALIAACMKAEGHDFVAEPTAARREFGNVSLDLLRTEGYGVTATIPAAKAPDTANQAAYDAALFGSQQDEVTVKLSDGTALGGPKEGCLAEARRQIYGDLERQLRLDGEPQVVRLKWTEAIEGDSRFQDALGQWRACMSVAGYSEDGPGSAAVELNRRLALGESREAVRSDELKTAAAEAKCSESSGIITVVTLLREEQARALPEEDKAVLRSLAEFQAEALARADR